MLVGFIIIEYFLTLCQINVKEKEGLMAEKNKSAQKRKGLTRRQHQRIVKFCEKNGITVAQFERECGLSNGYIAGLTNHTPTIDNITAIAKRMGITVTELIGK